MTTIIPLPPRPLPKTQRPPVPSGREVSSTPRGTTPLPRPHLPGRSCEQALDAPARPSPVTAETAGVGYLAVRPPFARPSGTHSAPPFPALAPITQVSCEFDRAYSPPSSGLVPPTIPHGVKQRRQTEPRQERASGVTRRSSPTG